MLVHDMVCDDSMMQYTPSPPVKSFPIKSP